MIAMICLFIPPLLFVYTRERIFQNHKNICESALNYAFCTLFLNCIMMGVSYYAFDSKEDLFYHLNEYIGFACKYVAISVFLAFIVPYAEKFMREKIVLQIHIPCSMHFSYWRATGIVYSIILFALNFIRIYDNNFWGDEAFTTNLVINNTVPGIIEGTAIDVHPPLYYLFVKIGYELVGDQGWMFHLVSLVPCALILIFALTTIWNRFGKEAAFVLITLATLSANAVRYNVEVRMYSWGGLFVLLSFYWLYRILTEQKNIHYVLFTMFSLAAAYTHYYCLVSVAFFYVIILFLAVIPRKLNLKKVLCSVFCTIAAYLPWFFILLNSMLERIDNYWITDIPTFKESVTYLFSEQFNTIAWVFICIGVIVVALYETSVLRIEKEKGGMHAIVISSEYVVFPEDFIWMFSGLVSILGTIIVAILISKVIRPFYIVRYIYPVSLVAWVILGVGLSKLKWKKVWTALLMIYMLVIFLPAYSKTYLDEKKMNDDLQATLAATINNIEVDDIVLTNEFSVYTQIAEYYYHNVKEVQWIEPWKLPELDENIHYWLVISGEQEMDYIYSQLETQGFKWIQVVDAGNLGTHTVYIYQLLRDESGSYTR